jgi:uncharacterized protein
MERVLILQNKHWDDTGYPNLLERNHLVDILKRLQLNEIQVLLGIRRSGKSTLFKLLINKLIQSDNPRSILYINFDDPFFSDVLSDSRQIYTIVEKAEQITGVKVQYLFIRCHFMKYSLPIN